LLYNNIDPFVILLLCMIWWAIWNILLRYFDEKIHKILNKRLKLKKEKQVLNQKKWIIRKTSHYIREKIQYINNKYLLFIGMVCASFSFVPDFLTVEFAHKKMNMWTFVFAMFLGKTVAYAPLIRGSIGFIKIIELYS